MSRVRFDIRQAQRPLLIGAIVLFVLNAGLYLGLVRPKINQLETRIEETNPQLQVMKQKQKEVEDLEAFVAALEKADVDLKTLREDVLSTRSRRMVEVQEEVAELCSKFNINLELVTYEHDVVIEVIAPHTPRPASES